MILGGCTDAMDAAARNYKPNYIMNENQYAPENILKKAITMLYPAYTQIYIPHCLFLTLQEVIIDLLSNYFEYVNRSCVNLTNEKRDEKLEAAYLGIRDSITESCKGKGLNFDIRFIEEMNRVFLAIKLPELFS